MKIFMCYNSQYALIVYICGSFRIREHIRRVEDIKPFVLHSTHVEIVGSNNVVNI